jgi:hypothetical protein
MLDQAPLKYVAGPKSWPTEVEVFSQKWRVIYCSNLADARGALGVTIPHERAILIDTSQSKESMTDVLWHEILHAILNMSPHWQLDSEAEEGLVRTLSPGVVSVLRNVKPWW